MVGGRIAGGGVLSLAQGLAWWRRDLNQLLLECLFLLFPVYVVVCERKKRENDDADADCNGKDSM